MKAQQKQVRKEKLEFETVRQTVTRHASIHGYEHEDLIIAVDDLQQDCAVHDTAVFEAAGAIADAISTLIELCDTLEVINDGVSGVCNQLGEDGAGLYDAAYQLVDHSSAIEDLNAELRETARTLIGLVRELIEIKD